MSAYRDVFARKELKYRISRRQALDVLAVCGKRIKSDEYGQTSIRSLYYDTPDRLLANRSLAKPLYKEKLRLRTYGTPEPTSAAFIEVKEKFKGVVYKRRIGPSFAAARAYLAGMPYEEACQRFPLSNSAAQESLFSARSMQIAREIDWFFSRYGRLEPALALTCRRQSFTEVLELSSQEEGASRDSSGASSALVAEGLAPTGLTSGVRITFDSSICWSEPLLKDKKEKLLIPESQVIMEIKAAGALPLWLVHVLDEVQVRPCSFSKYGEAYQASLVQRKTGKHAASRMSKRSIVSPRHAKGGERCA